MYFSSVTFERTCVNLSKFIGGRVTRNFNIGELKCIVLSLMKTGYFLPKTENYSFLKSIEGTFHCISFQYESLSFVKSA